MESDQSIGLPPTLTDAPAKSNEVCQVTAPLSPITNDDANDSSFDEGYSGDSGFHTGSEPTTDESGALERVAAASEIVTILSRYPQISVQLLEWARIFIEEEPQMLSHSSTIVEAHPDTEKAHAEFHRGVSAICRIVTDERLTMLRNWALQLEGEWQEALATGKAEPEYAQYIDLMYSEATSIVEGDTGQYRYDADVRTVGEVFGFAKQDAAGSGNGGLAAEGGLSAES